MASKRLAPRRRAKNALHCAKNALHYAQALLSSLPISYAVEKDLLQGREPTPENVALGASQLAMALTDLLAKTVENVPGANEQF